MDVDDFIKTRIATSKDADFLRILLSPVRKSTDGSLWPFENAADGLIWLTKVTSDDAEQSELEDFALWVHLSQLRFTFFKKDTAAAEEIYKICCGFKLFPPEEIQEFILNGFDRENLITLGNRNERSKWRLRRVIINEVQNLKRLFRTKNADAIGCIQRRFEDAGATISDTTLNDYNNRDKREAFSKSWRPDDSFLNDLTEDEINEFRKIWIERYPADCFEVLIKNCSDDVKKTLLKHVKNN